MRFITKLLVFFIFVVSLLTTGANAVEGNAPNNGWDYEGQMIAITLRQVQWCNTVVSHSWNIMPK